jgi:hypothetical protein
MIRCFYHKAETVSFFLNIFNLWGLRNRPSRPAAFFLHHRLGCPWANTQHTADSMSYSFDQDKLADQTLSVPEEMGSKFLSFFVMSTLLTNEELASNFLFHKRIISKLPRFLPRIWCLSVKGKAIPLQAWTGPEGSRSLRLPDFKTFRTWRW